MSTHPRNGFDIRDAEVGRTINQAEVEREARLAAESREQALLAELELLRRQQAEQ